MNVSRRVVLAVLGAMVLAPVGSRATVMPKATPIYPNRIPKSFSADSYDGGYTYSLETDDSAATVDAWYLKNTTGFKGEHVTSEIVDSYHYEKHSDGGAYSLQIQKQSGEPTSVTYSFTAGA